MSNKTARSILEKLVDNRIEAPKMGITFYDIGSALADLYTLLKLPEKKICPE